MNDNLPSRIDRRVGERRKHRRYFVDLPIDCRLIENSKHGFCEAGMTENAGTGGLSLFLNERIPAGRQLLLELYYKDGFQFSSLKILAEVVWNHETKEVNGYKHGLKLVRLESGGRRKLQSLLRNYPCLI